MKKPPVILDVRNLSVIFQDSTTPRTIIKDLSFTISTGETFGIVGESGSGKSVTALSLMRLIRRPPLLNMSGNIFFKENDLMSFSHQQMRRVRGKAIGFIFQEPMSALNPVLTIGDQLTEMLYAHGSVTKAEAIDRSVALLHEMGIPGPRNRLHNYPHELSGGMRQRAMIAMALSCDPDLLIADEPTTALDVTVQSQILSLFQHIKLDRHMSLMFITHDLRVIAEVADHVLVMHNGRSVETTDIDSLFHTPQHPYTRMLLDLLSDRGCYNAQ